MNMPPNRSLVDKARIASALHDTVVQTINATRLALELTQRRVSDTVYTRDSLDRICAWLERASVEVGAAFDPLPATACVHDLAAELSNVAEECSVHRRMDLCVNIRGSRRPLDVVAGDEILLIGSEAIRNAYRRSRGRQLRIDLAYDQGFVLRISDDGRGMQVNPSSMPVDGHLGLAGMRERAARIGATLALTSSPVTGTEVTLTAPGERVYGA